MPAITNDLSDRARIIRREIAYERKRPTHNAYHVGEEQGLPFSIPIGTAWKNPQGKGFILKLDYIPRYGRVSLRVASSDQE